MYKKTLLPLMVLGIANVMIATDPIIPLDSQIGKSDNSLQKLLINPMEQNRVIRKGGWHLENLSDEPAKIPPKAGSVALALSGTADIKGGKGDFVLANNPPGQCQILGAWVYLDDKSNVEKLGFQVYDGEGEALMATVPADWKGWKWLEIDVNADNFKQAYDQKDKNSKPDFPLKSVNFVWFSAGPGVSTCIVDGLTAATIIAGGTTPQFLVNVSQNDWGENNTQLKTDLFLTNFTDKPAACSISFSIQEDSHMYKEKAPDPVWGNDHALGTKSWVEVEGKKIDDDSLTDGDDGSSFGTDYRKEYYTDAFQYVDLGKERNIQKIDFKSGDANWCWRMDVLASVDGKNYQPVPELQNVNMLKRWGTFTIGPKTPFNARFLKLHFKSREEGQKENVIRMPAAIMIYDGAADENMSIPQVGPEIDKGSETVNVPPKSFAMVSITSKKPLTTGGYFVGLQAKYGDVTQVFYKNYFVMPPPLTGVTADSRFGVNASTPALAEFHNRMGLGWVRFENMKWAMICPEKEKYAFDGSVKPWMVNEDEIIKDYTQKYQLNYLPYVFQTPRWASSAPDKHKNSKGFPPKDYNDYGTCIFQIVARYGSKKHPADKLLTNDKISGLNQFKVIELWNEPNLVGESWAPWVGPIEKYFDIFRIGAEAAKKADPDIKVTSCGWAGILLDVIGKMATYKYSDGKTPVDFTDILNVHYYSGKADPELATIDRNVMRGSKPEPGDRTYEDNLRDLVSWWEKVNPGKPIWLTETGYDVGGPIGRDERYQAAKLPRCTMMAMAAGIDKVFIYRERGSNASQHAGAGFLRNDNSVRPSWFAFATLVRQLNGVKPDKILSLHIPGNDEIWGYLWDRNGKKVFSVWGLDDKSKLPLKLGKCTVTDSFGREKKIEVNGDLQLSIFPTYLTDIANIEPVNQLVKTAEAKEEAREAKQKRLGALRKYLFDFGSTEDVGILKNYGPGKRFTPVMAETLYEDANGYGFETKGLGNQSAKWISDLIDKDSVKVNKHPFKFKAEPGKYHLELSAEPFAPTGQVTIKGISGGEKNLEISKKEPKIALDVQVGQEPVSIICDGYTHLRWITLIEKE